MKVTVRKLSYVPTSINQPASVNMYSLVTIKELAVFLSKANIYLHLSNKSISSHPLSNIYPVFPPFYISVSIKIWYNNANLKIRAMYQKKISQNKPKNPFLSNILELLLIIFFFFALQWVEFWVTYLFSPVPLIFFLTKDVSTRLFSLSPF